MPCMQTLTITCVDVGEAFPGDPTMCASRTPYDCLEKAAFYREDSLQHQPYYKSKIEERGDWRLEIGYWVLDIRYWVLDIGYWILGIGDWRLDIGDWGFAETVQRGQRLRAAG